MAVSEIADNKWELEASKAPVGTLTGIAQIGMFLGFLALFGYIIGMSVVAMVTPAFSVLVTGVFSLISSSLARCSSVNGAPNVSSRSTWSTSPSLRCDSFTSIRPSSQPFRSAYIRNVIDVHAPSDDSNKL